MSTSTPKLYNDREFTFAVKMLRDIIASEQKRLDSMIEGYTTELVKLPYKERIPKLADWLSQAMGHQVSLFCDDGDIRVQMCGPRDDSLSDKFEREVQKVFPGRSILPLPELLGENVVIYRIDLSHLSDSDEDDSE